MEELTMRDRLDEIQRQTRAGDDCEDTAVLHLLLRAIYEEAESALAILERNHLNPSDATYDGEMNGA